MGVIAYGSLGEEFISLVLRADTQHVAHNLSA